ncbi:MAG: 7,8-didemethyl-8-hydroxy-5-deazariboflavin synthase subunit CofG [Limnothrix sp. RL_2_0]|nr:7,8-didemethyl-8-hydroxy-5-deazariboflavin synthase subunit CofG [Limnothrix sp. RL_2_0]
MVLAKAQITYSPAFTLVPTYECFNRCGYCNFRVSPQSDQWLTLERARHLLEKLQKGRVTEILILSGEVYPESKRRSPLINLIKELCVLALELGFIPHTNAGPLSWDEMKLLGSVNGSMGLMLEQMRGDLAVHRRAPSKNPELRLQQLDWAGQLRIPFTTGLLLGIGESAADWVESLQAIAAMHQKWGHIQEVILQPHSPGKNQVYEGLGFDPQRLPEVIRLARRILPTAIAIQIPPNLVPDPNWLLNCIEAGARDLGGIVPKDEVNPDYHHLELPKLDSLLAENGWQLTPRLAVYPQYKSWISPAIQSVINHLEIS